MKALRRHPSVLAVGIALAMILVVTIVGVVWFWPPAPTTTSDYLAADALVLTAGTFLLAVVGAGVAAYAYAQSIRRPHLDMLVTVYFYDPTSRQTGARPRQRTVQAQLGSQNQAPIGAWRLPSPQIHINLLNTGEVTARNATVSVYLSGIQIGPEGHITLPRGWTVIQHSIRESTMQLQWGGGADIAVHPGVIQSRDLDIKFPTAAAHPGANIHVIAFAFADGAEPARDEYRMLIIAPPEPEQAPTPDVA